MAWIMIFTTLQWIDTKPIKCTSRKVVCDGGCFFLTFYQTHSKLHSFHHPLTELQFWFSFKSDSFCRLPDSMQCDYDEIAFFHLFYSFFPLNSFIHKQPSIYRPNGFIRRINPSNVIQSMHIIFFHFRLALKEERKKSTRNLKVREKENEMMTF